MSKKAAAAATPAAGGAALACGNAACGKALAPPLLQCSKCKGEAYCCKACQVGDPGATAAHSAPYAYSLAMYTFPPDTPRMCLETWPLCVRERESVCVSVLSLIHI